MKSPNKIKFTILYTLAGLFFSNLSFSQDQDIINEEEQLLINLYQYPSLYNWPTPSENHSSHKNNTHSGNNTIIYQDGIRNTTIVNISGKGNKTTLIQEGHENLSKINSKAGNNEFEILQKGNENIIKQSVSSEHTKFIIKQRGDNNVLYQIDNGNNWKRPIMVNQTGNNMRLTIELKKNEY
ncbi:hypothetical protein [Xanthovirga aplysinae]|uniref:hypothetical protein n=1 Tax=Xanthovirga aplysinae TaxID=2529853 RepID=UPI0012BBBDBD|nr:hypothetical protein [Xanthovirga aplysinae]MTI31283.1 hypothetical protein [Xanthovirga aplysinae]